MAARRLRPTPPRPELVRRPPRGFGWLDARLLHEDWLPRLGPDALAVLVLLALAADRHGASFYGRPRMAAKLGLNRAAVDAGLARLLDLGLVLHRPWRPGDPDGVWQLVPLPPELPRDDAGPATVGAVLSRLGIIPHRRNPADPGHR